jgi:acetyl-CoA carboxylase carboxyl transferase subunit alpha
VIPFHFDFEQPLQELQRVIDQLKQSATQKRDAVVQQVSRLETECRKRMKEIYSHLTPMQTVQVARHPERPVLTDYIPLICSDFFELHGDRHFGDDQALIGGLATLAGTKVMLIGHSKGKTVDENVTRNFGMARPEGYRKALRLMKLAEKYHLPVVSFIDTAGAYPGLDAEERGQAHAIATNLVEMSRLRTPIIAVVTGEGGSGGALGIAVGDVVLMLSHAVYSVISPEGCASILWRDASFAPQAAKALKLDAKSLKELGIIDDIIPEPIGGAQKDPAAAASSIKNAISAHLARLQAQPLPALLERRFEKFSSMGMFHRE